MVATSFRNEDFDLVANCIRQNQIEIEKSLLTVQKIFPIGSLTLENSFVNNIFGGSTVYKCTNGQTSAVIPITEMTLVVGNLNAGNDSYDNITNFIGYVSSNGKIYSRESANLDEQKPEVPISDLICTDSKGQFLQSYISSIPERITNMDNRQ